jgi:GTP-binding protein EngB required for normal cell division
MSSQSKISSQTSQVKMKSFPLRPATPDPTTTHIIVNDQEMISINQKLKKLGIEQTIQLPQICVIGDQSTGKSSLIEALSMIKVPRDAACCTRCPLEVNLIKPDDDSRPWVCKISLIQKYDLDQSAKPVPTAKRPLGAWTELTRAENIPFVETDVKEDVRDLILRAQAAILNPHLEPATFISGPLNKRYNVKFSPNAVRLDIVQHDLPSLSFVDLPGIVAVQSEKYLVELVDNLVSHYARSQRSINLLTVPMTNDYENSKAMSKILDLEAEGRTLAVMTKPDLYPMQSPLNGVLAKLDGKGNPPMDHGYHVVMMSPDDTLSHAAARQMEAEYFGKNERWATLGPAYKERLGVLKLSKKLSTVLQEATRRSLPTSLLLIKRRLEKVQNRLEAMPAPPGLQQMSIALTTLINDFGDKMLKLFEGGGNADDFLLKPRWDRLAEGFRVTVLNSRPKLCLLTNSESTQKRKADRLLAEPVLVFDEDIPQPPSTGRKVARTSTSPSETYHSFQLEEIRGINQRHATAGLGPQMFPGARQAMMRKSLDKLDGITEAFVKETSNLIKEHVVQHSRQVLRHYEHMPLHAAVMKCIQSFADECCQQLFQESMGMCEIEMAKPYTLDSITSVREAKKYLTILLNSRADMRLKLEKAVHDASQIGKARKTEFRKKIADLDDDEWDTEIELLANVRAYHQIAASRHADNVCQTIFARTFPKLAFEMVGALNTLLGPMEPEKHDQMVKWMSENPERELERNRLLDEQASLLEARALVQKALGKDTKLASMQTGKRKSGADGEVEMGGSGTEVESDGESPLKKTKFDDVNGLQPSVEDDMDES